MKILFVLEYYYPHIGGVEKLFQSLGESLISRKHEVVILTNKHRSNLPSYEVYNGVKIHRVKSFNRFLFSILSIPKAIKLARHCDIIHTTSYNAALPARIAAILQSKKSIITFHEVWAKLWYQLPFISIFKKWMFHTFESWILNLKFDRFVAVSKSTQKALISAGVDKNNTTLIYNGIDYPEQENLHDYKGPFIFTYFGRIGISKGLDLLIPAAAKFIKDNPESHFKIICPKGDISLLNKIQKLIKAHQIEQSTTFVFSPEYKTLVHELNHSSCCVIPSYSEGFCFVAAELAALNIPIISSGKQALSEVVSGKFIQISALKPEAIFQALKKAKQQEYDKSEIKRFELSDCIQNYIDLYEELADSKS